ncbi:MAG: alpha/beta fold hydrolase [Halanaeroarchaeum sp.]
MRARTLLAGLAAGVGGTALANRALADRVGPLEPPLEGRDRSYRWRGYDVSYVEAGDPDRETVVLVHGIHAAASAREFRAIFGALASTYHVVAPDLPGFGTSDRPPVVYDASTYEGFCRDVLAEFDAPTVIASSLSGAFVAAAARETDVSALVLIGPTDETGPRSTLVRELFRAPVLGQGLFNLLVSRPSIRYFDRDLAYADPAAATEDVMDYQWRTAHQPNARYAPASFVGGFLDPSESLESSLRAADVPVTLVWGLESTRPSVERGRELADAVDATLVTIGDASLLVHDEHPNEFLDAVVGVLPRLEHH